MHTLARRWAAEWERVLLCASVLLFALFLLGSLFGWRRDGSGVAGTGRALVHESLLAADALAFLETPELRDPQAPCPFAFSAHVAPAPRGAAPARAVRPGPSRAPRPRARATEPATPAPPAAPAAPEPAPPAAPRARRVRGTVTYLYSTTTGSGKPVAFVQLVHPHSNEKRVLPLSVGASVAGAVVRAFDADALRIVGADGRECRVPFGEQGSVTFEVAP